LLDVAEIINSCPQLKNLIGVRKHCLTDELVPRIDSIILSKLTRIAIEFSPSMITATIMVSLAKHCKNLSIIFLCFEMESLNTSTFSSIEIVTLIQNNPNITELTIARVGGAIEGFEQLVSALKNSVKMKQLFLCCNSDCQTELVCELMKSLVIVEKVNILYHASHKTLIYELNDGFKNLSVSGFTCDDVDLIFENLFDFSHIFISTTSDLNSVTIQRLTTLNTNLISFVLDRCLWGNDATLIYGLRLLVQKSTFLNTFKINFSESMRDSCHQFVVNLFNLQQSKGVFTKLRTIAIQNCFGFETKTIKAIFKLIPKLQFFGLLLSEVSTELMEVAQIKRYFRKYRTNHVISRADLTNFNLFEGLN
jgi:hypothetical protein